MILGAIGKQAAKLVSRAVGGHLVQAHLHSVVGGAGGTFENLVAGVGLRFIFGFGTALYFDNPEFRAWINQAPHILSQVIGF